MLISRISTITGAKHIREIPVTNQQMDARVAGALIQDAMPNLSVDDREFMLSGITPEEWEATFGAE